MCYDTVQRRPGGSAGRGQQGLGAGLPDGHENHPIEGGSTGCRKS